MMWKASGDSISSPPIFSDFDTKGGSGREAVNIVRRLFLSSSSTLIPRAFSPAVQWEEMLYFTFTFRLLSPPPAFHRVNCGPRFSGDRLGSASTTQGNFDGLRIVIAVWCTWKRRSDPTLWGALCGRLFYLGIQRTLGPTGLAWARPRLRSCRSASESRASASVEVASGAHPWSVGIAFSTQSHEGL